MKLSKLFRGAALAVGLGFPAILGGAYIALLQDFHSNGGEASSLTEGETLALRSIFGDQLQTESIRIYRKNADALFEGMSHAAAFVATVPLLGNNVYIRSRYANDDYSGYADPSRAAIFIHEITHVWQYQSSRFPIPGIMDSYVCENSDDKYSYELKAGDSFGDFCMEQQAEIVADYALYWLPHLFAADNFAPDVNDEAQESPLILRDIVEAQFPAARETRLAAERAREKKAADISRTLPAPGV